MRVLRGDGSGYGIRMQRFYRFGARRGPPRIVNSYRPGHQTKPAFAALPNDSFIIVWQSWRDGSGFGIYAQRYDWRGRLVGTKHRVNTGWRGHQTAPVVVALKDVGWVIGWQSWGQDGSGYGIFAQRYNKFGQWRGGEFRANTFTPRNQTGPSIAALKDGGYLILWQSFGQDGSEYGIYQQRYNRYGWKRGGEMRVNTVTRFWQWQPAGLGLDDGGWLALWQSNGPDGSGFGIRAQRYNIFGAPVDGEFTVNTTTDNQQIHADNSPHLQYEGHRRLGQ